MEVHDFAQGSPEWHEHRASHFNASDAPAMLGCSPYKSRSELLHEFSTGIIKEVDAATQRRFDDGHRYEALARPIAEQIIGRKLYPVVGSEGKYSASFDGLTSDDSDASEHKSLNDDLRAAMPNIGFNENITLPKAYRVQMEQQCLVSGCTRVLFMASKWNGDTLVEERHCWYYPDAALRAEIIAGWDQFQVDLDNYVPAVVVEPAVAAPTLNLPSVSVQVKGAIELISNLPKFGTALKEFISKIPEQPSTDQEFADCKSAIGKLQEAQDALDAAEAHALGQIVTFDEMKREKTLLFDLARVTRLALEKLVTKREAEIKLEIMQGGKDKLAEHIAALNNRLGKPYMPAIVADWAAAIKNKRTIASLQNSVDTLLSQKKIEASAIADKVDTNLKSLRELAKDHIALFADTSSIVLKSNDELVNLINSRINEFKAAKAAEDEALRAKIAEEERVKAEAKVRAEQEAIAEKARQEQAVIVEAERKALAAQAKPAQPETAATPAQATLLKPATAWPFPGTEAAKAIETQTKPTTPPTLTLGKIASRLGFNLSADFLRSIGFEPEDGKGSAKLYHESDWPFIKSALIEHIRTAGDDQQQAA